MQLNDFKFPRFEYWFYFKGLWRERGAKAIYKQFQKHLRRPFSRSLVTRYSSPPYGKGLEIGVGARTIAPVSRTLLADGYESHGNHRSIAQTYFPAAAIPFADETFDFVLSEHTLEHIGNALRALTEWNRVLRPGGHLILFLPHKERTNDRLRERTPLAHLIEDFQKNIPDDDTTHVEEWIQNVTKAGGIPEHYRHVPTADLARTGSIHHHVWIAADIKEALEYLGLEIVYCDERVIDRTDSFVVVGRKRL
ncbi:class I SAM-dependent methyltransferase [Turneriella parva]|uniref:Methyltransferase type 11 n=1 Tax=Turneriella parva (strain ATCC BAA-1111 / DSM 21527 / NCTC 11395 / H) TaxID=869212 RepID=I4B7L4_TURPD|nr:class I SAM-dependent methyltransferase [Turneriella parva]AFM13271.1 Methyltransferase type 11 [Turneriella parva DSM 21527]